LQDVYVDVETDESQFATVKEGFSDRQLTFVPLIGIRVGISRLSPLQAELQANQRRQRTPPFPPLTGVS
jgi:hypothetical protein